MSYKGVVFEKESDYILTGTTIKDKIIRVDAIIEALELAALDNATNDGVQSYSLDDGQVKINKSYKGVEAIHKSIFAFEKYRQRLINKIDGNVVTLMDSGNFKNNRI